MKKISTNAEVNQYKSIPLGYLKGFLIIMMIAFHSLMAYNIFLPQQYPSLLTKPYLWMISPIIDTVRNQCFSIYVIYFNTFAMALFFFISGLFVWKSIKRKGGGSFFKDRMLRLGLPFIIITFFFSPLSYYPSYLVSTTAPSLSEFCKIWLSLENWSAGPVWFIWLLMAFDVIALSIYFIIRKFRAKSAVMVTSILRHPIAVFGILVVLSASVYIPMLIIFGPFHWASSGPFTFQTCRLLHYGTYFILGTIIGAYGIDEGLLEADGRLAKSWPCWLILSAVTFVIYLAIFRKIATFFDFTLAEKIFLGIISVITCAFASFAFLSLFTRFARKQNRIFDSIARNAYGMFLVHYGFVSWFQYSLLGLPLSAAAKGSIVILFAVVLSWGTVSILLRIPAVARIV